MNRLFRHLSGVFLTANLVAVSAWAGPHHVKGLPHMDLEMTGPEYTQLLKARTPEKPLLERWVDNVIRFFDGDDNAQPQRDAEDPILENYLAMGQKNLQWVDLINAHRPAQQKISFSSEATQQGFPISAPRVMNFKVVKNTWDILHALLPSPLKAVIFEGAALTETLPVSEREFTEWLFQVDRAYQLAARYTMMKPWRQEMAEVANWDVRGYLILKEEVDLNTKLLNWENLSLGQQEKFTKALTSICRNSGVAADSCHAEFQTKKNASQLVDFKDQYMAGAEVNYNSFFQIPRSRVDGTWAVQDDGTEVLSFPFADPHNQVVTDYLKINIEAEWRWLNWTLRLDFVESESPDTTHVVFVPGSTPHVNDIAGSEITMDANAPLSEYDVQWTIRHEYGHVVGFPDCYIEFYDAEEDAIVSYQLDITNLMCSRRGHLQEKHFTEMVNAYKTTD